MLKMQVDVLNVEPLQDAVMSIPIVQPIQNGRKMGAQTLNNPDHELKLVLQDPAVLTRLSNIGMILWMCSKSGHYHLNEKELEMLEKFTSALHRRDHRETAAKFNEVQIREFCGYLTAYLIELRYTHPGMVWAGWESYLAAVERERLKAIKK